MKTIEEMRQETAVPVVISDHQGLITQVNQAFESVFGWRASEIVGQPLTRLIPAKLRDAHRRGFSRFLATGRPTMLSQPLKLRSVTKEGREFDTEHTIIAEQCQGAWVFGATIRPLG